mgnify:CR=1 FL=1
MSKSYYPLPALLLAVAKLATLLPSPKYYAYTVPGEVRRYGSDPMNPIEALTQSVHDSTRVHLVFEILAPGARGARDGPKK